MTRSGRRDQALAIVLAGLAGYVDAVGFLATGGFFLSFMSGNSTRMGVGFGAALGGEPGDFRTSGAVAAGLIGTFVVGVVAGALAGHGAGRWRRPAVLALVAALLAGAALCGARSLTVPATILAVLAMGTENAVFERDGEVSIGLTYMTGTLVKTGQGIARALTGGSRWGWLPHALLWAGFAAGAVAGAALFPVFGLPTLGLAAAGFAVAAVATAAVRPVLQSAPRS